eukprot:scaffold4937_cov261-Pinguiococcus_pyrenoidosus.AAC.6
MVPVGAAIFFDTYRCGSGSIGARIDVPLGTAGASSWKICMWSRSSDPKGLGPSSCGPWRRWRCKKATAGSSGSRVEPTSMRTPTIYRQLVRTPEPSSGPQKIQASCGKIRRCKDLTAFPFCAWQELFKLTTDSCGGSQAIASLRSWGTLPYEAHASSALEHASGPHAFAQSEDSWCFFKERRSPR